MWNEYWYEQEYGHEQRYLTGNCYKTREEAKQALEIKKIDTELRRYALEHNECDIDWENFKQPKYSIYYDYQDKELDISWDSCGKEPNIYFSSEEIAEAAIEAIGRERVEMWVKA